MNFDERIKLIDELIGQWFSETKINMAKPSELERYLVEKNVYPEYREGWFLREDLRSLECQHRLNIFQHTKLVRATRSWTFYPIEKVAVVDEKRPQSKLHSYIPMIIIVLLVVVVLIVYKR